VELSSTGDHELLLSHSDQDPIAYEIRRWALPHREAGKAVRFWAPLLTCRRSPLVADIDWPPHAVTMRVLDLEGHEVHSAVKGDDKN
jgi:hypothetical protein